VTELKYLGHNVTKDMSEVKDIEKELRSLAARCNMLARRFLRCNAEVKITLFEAYCQTFYTSSLWVACTQRACNDLRVQYNNGLRILLGLPRWCSASQMFADAQVDVFLWYNEEENYTFYEQDARQQQQYFANTC
ncbi:jg17511, partial [Pararge aegeria aegeria]